MGYRLLDTALGTMGIGWTGLGLVRLLLPGEGPTIMRERLAGRCGEELQNGMADLTRRVRAYAEGARDDFADIELDLSGIPELNRRIYGYIRTLGWGETTTYGAIARWLGDVALSRAVGTAMGANPIPLIVPCHRVLAADGRTGGFSSPEGVRTKMRLLALERAAAPNGQFSFGF
ncbi:MAG: methylated-DNA--[protein]-cysteine S-methyltransferase [Devosia sp.]|nr:methylated-DNA--[protein]-cysteine S-methyltransferase [Devosia sp.]